MSSKSRSKERFVLFFHYNDLLLRTNLWNRGSSHHYEQIDARTGMVINLVDLKSIMKESIMDKLDHKNLDLDVEEIRSTRMITTTENLAVFIWSSLLENQKLPRGLLYEVKIHETENNVVMYRGE